jgi:PBP1b-binding outer membrane lipoprotein LpoB
METTIFKSDKMDFVAGGAKREELRAEKQDQLSNASTATAASIGNEVGADFMLFGTLKTIIDKSGNKSIRTYYVSAEMTNIETNQRLWMGRHEIEKIIVKPKNKL